MRGFLSPASEQPDVVYSVIGFIHITAYVVFFTRLVFQKHSQQNNCVGSAQAVICRLNKHSLLAASEIRFQLINYFPDIPPAVVFIDNLIFRIVQ